MAKSSSTKVNRGGRPRALSEAEAKRLVELVRTKPSITLDALVVAARQEIGRPISLSTAQRVLRERGVGRVKRPRTTVAPPSPPFRYAAQAQAPRGSQRYAATLSDAEWELLAPVFARRDARGKPERYTRRQVLDAIQFVVRSGCPWRMLPKNAPPWQLVYATFRRWAREGRFELMHDLLRARWRERQGREVTPTTAVLDSQSVRTAEGGESAVTMRRKRSRDASAIS